MYITILGAHNIESKSTRNVCLLVDGVLALDAGCLTSSLTFEEQMKLKAILLSHGHFDHVRDIPAIGMNLSLHKKSLDMYAIGAVFETMETHLLNDILYPAYFRRPHNEPTLRRNVLEPGRSVSINGYSVLAVPTVHSLPSAALEITSPEGKKLFYSGDTGPGLEAAWNQVDPDLVIIEVTALNQYEKFAREAGHLTPVLLGHELESLKKIRGSLPRIVTLHMNPLDEIDLRKELDEVGTGLGITIDTAYEGMHITV